MPRAKKIKVEEPEAEAAVATEEIAEAESLTSEDAEQIIAESPSEESSAENVSDIEDVESANESEAEAGDDIEEGDDIPDDDELDEDTIDTDIDAVAAEAEAAEIAEEAAEGVDVPAEQEMVAAKDESEFDLSDFEDDSSYVMSNQMIQLMKSAVYLKQILTGRVSGVTNTKLGVVARVLYAAPSDSTKTNRSTTVLIPADKMNLNKNEISRNVRRLATRSGVDIKNQRKYNILADRVKMRIIGGMIGAKVDFVPTEYLPDSNIVVGDRTAAMERAQKRFAKVGTRSMNRTEIHIGKGTTVLARILRVAPGGLEIEIAGFTSIMGKSDISSMAIDVEKEYHVGDSIKVQVTEVIQAKDGRVAGFKAIGSRVNHSAARARVAEYRIGDIVNATVISVRSDGTAYNLRMDNGCRGITYFSKAMLNHRIVTGSKISCKVTGYTPNKEVVRCLLVSVL